MTRDNRMKKLILFLGLSFLSWSAMADELCHGAFVDPIADVCWSCMFPITIGSMEVLSGDAADTDNPSMPICLCSLPTIPPIPRLGITVGFWEPMALVDVSRHPFCMVTLGGIQFDMGAQYYGTGYNQTATSSENSSFYYVHWYVYPLLYWLNIITDTLCVQQGDLDIAYMTELDPTWRDDEMGFLMNPEAILFGNPISQAACAADSIAASTHLPIDSLFWCAGSQGGMYPLTGHVQEHVGGVQASTLITERMTYKMHRMGALSDSVGENSPALCTEYHPAFIPKSRYRYQMVYPLPTVGAGGCYPFGATTSIWGAGHEYPVTGEDFGYLVFRKRNCCML
jgi:conjugal transfer pilus assembly protein TraU